MPLGRTSTPSHKVKAAPGDQFSDGDVTRGTPGKAGTPWCGITRRLRVPRRYLGGPWQPPALMLPRLGGVATHIKSLTESVRQRIFGSCSRSPTWQAMREADP